MIFRSTTVSLVYVSFILLFIKVQYISDSVIIITFRPGSVIDVHIVHMHICVCVEGVGMGACLSARLYLRVYVLNFARFFCSMMIDYIVYHYS
jgi:hypothetical protein